MPGGTLDPDGLRYLEHWEPVLEVAARRTLDRLGPTPAELLDLGAGTGSLTVAALARWPSVHVQALDASGAMLGVARSRIPAGDLERVAWVPADAARIPLADASSDAVVSSFMLQVVDDRPAVMTEVHRVLRPGGVFSFVTWLAEDLVLPADAAYHETLGDLDDDDADEDLRSPRSGDYRSLDQARDELLAAGFVDVEVGRDELCHRWTPHAYLRFKLDYDDRERIETLDPDRRAELRADLERRLAELPPRDFEVRGPLVAGVARRS